MDAFTKRNLIDIARVDFSTFTVLSIGEYMPGLIWAPYLNLVTARVNDLIVGHVQRLNG